MRRSILLPLLLSACATAEPEPLHCDFAAMRGTWVNVPDEISGNTLTIGPGGMGGETVGQTLIEADFSSVGFDLQASCTFDMVCEWTSLGDTIVFNELVDETVSNRAVADEISFECQEAYYDLQLDGETLEVWLSRVLGGPSESIAYTRAP